MKTKRIIGIPKAVIFFVLAVLSVAAHVQAAAKAEYKRTLENYIIPEVTLLNQDGKEVELKSILEPGKPVIIDFIFTTCTTICPVLSANYLNMQNKLGDAADTIQLVSISIDPEHDRPDQMLNYLKKFRAKKGWVFLTGSRDEIKDVMRAFDASVVDKMSHIPLYILHGPKAGEWVRIHGLIGASDLMEELGRLAK